MLQIIKKSFHFPAACVIIREARGVKALFAYVLVQRFGEQQSALVR